jgi:predicted nuclease of restriction endonuclease-like RecB superfamily
VQRRTYPDPYPTTSRDVLTKDLLRVSRAGGGYHPQFVDPDDPERETLAAAVRDAYRDHVGRERAALEDALTDLEREADDFKLVRGFAKLLEREATFETRTVVDPPRARRVTFEAAERVGVVTADERGRALDAAADRLGVAPDAVADALFADREERQVLAAFEPRWTRAELPEQYNLSLAQTALFDATEIRVRTTEPKELVSAVKRLRLMYEVRRLDGENGTGEGPTDARREVVVTGPTALFARSRRYGTRFARLLRTVASAPAWRLEATIDDRGRERTLVLDGDDVSVPGVEPVTEMTFDSGVEADFAARFRALDLDWRLVREPDPLAAGAHVLVPDFAFDWAPGGDPAAGPDVRIYFEVMGFWTPEYVEKKLSRIADLEDVDLLVAVDEDLGVGEDLEARDACAIPYSGTVRMRDVRDALRRYEDDLVGAAADALPDTLVPEADVVTLAALADAQGVSESAIENKRFPEHRRIGRTLVRPAVLERLADRLEAGMPYADAESAIDEAGIDDASAALSAIGYRVAWEGLSGGSLEERTGSGN